ncbi:hypothetical protein [Methylobacterium symbioticum]|uniref:Uncharacterized protein n=1 Tax=Methylobacterium symbioticum TaxID=2584084 RepID=A0A509E7W7_9HYPH|nr:hypothetical protein [Methylobacterium symbioticum]VUD70212.1 hypothetical protein MET9862_00775 [Methylobacterium symbioticum]
MQERIAPLVREAATLEYIADALAQAAGVHAGVGDRGGARTLRRMSREHRVKAMLRRGLAAAILGRELPAAGPR